MTERLKRLAPPGTDLSKRLLEFWLWICCIAVFHLVFYAKLYSALDDLYYYRYGEKVMAEYTVMKPLGELLDHTLAGFLMAVLWQLFRIFSNYRSFYRESRSIYLMKRLPGKMELHRRCIGLPAVFIMGFMAIAALLTAFAFAVYFTKTPKQCLPTFMEINLWRMLI